MPLPKSPRRAFAPTAALCLALVLTACAADEKPAAAGKSPAGASSLDKSPANQPAAAAPTAADMEAFFKMNQPGEHHAHLKQLAGTFDVDMETVMAPGTPPMKSKGVSKSEMIMNGRYLHATYNGDMMGMAFEGNSLMGYDVVKKKYFNAWVDSMTTGLTTFEGACDKGGKVFTFTGQMDDPMSGRKMKIRHVTTIVSPDKYTFEWFESAEGAPEHRGMYATYVRRK